ncbi:hypothetical protein CYMTET_30160 [Cymbomonas tetramitiformis]|uniref:NAD(P)-binding domain-containing protein n=1 Tax=Cymbomonas tetramitiformis TaxID=36881 RepID=A0AAE0FJK7_9CHLO|nr:hypothetical protein CYMTET_30160 [Cymbomonas tetramitiformis]
MVWRLMSTLALGALSSSAASSIVAECAAKEAPQRRAIVFGATGATGQQVVKNLLNSKRSSWEVTAVSRRPFFNDTAGLVPLVVDNLGSKSAEVVSVTALLKGNYDAVFVCTGTTRGAAGSADAFVDVEVGLTRQWMRVGADVGVLHTAVVSAQHANKDLWVPSTLLHPLLYLRTLGQKQQAVIEAEFPSCSIFQPGMLNRLQGDRLWENVVNYMGIGLRVDHLARAMIADAEDKLETLNASFSREERDDAGEKVIEFFGGNVNIEVVARRYA